MLALKSKRAKSGNTYCIIAKMQTQFQLCVKTQSLVNLRNSNPWQKWRITLIVFEKCYSVHFDFWPITSHNITIDTCWVTFTLMVHIFCSDGESVEHDDAGQHKEKCTPHRMQPMWLVCFCFACAILYGEREILDSSTAACHGPAAASAATWCRDDDKMSLTVGCNVAAV